MPWHSLLRAVNKKATAGLGQATLKAVRRLHSGDMLSSESFPPCREDVSVCRSRVIDRARDRPCEACGSCMPEMEPVLPIRFPEARCRPEDEVSVQGRVGRHDRASNAVMCGGRHALDIRLGKGKIRRDHGNRCVRGAVELGAGRRRTAGCRAEAAKLVVLLKWRRPEVRSFAHRCLPDRVDSHQGADSRTRGQNG